jgi:hypothetical protein
LDGKGFPLVHDGAFCAGVEQLQCLVADQIHVDCSEYAGHRQRSGYCF